MINNKKAINKEKTTIKNLIITIERIKIRIIDKNNREKTNSLTKTKTTNKKPKKNHNLNDFNTLFSLNLISIY